MIIQGHPDILLGPQGLNGLHGFGSLPPKGASPAYIRFMPEKGGAGIEALYQEIRDFINTPGRTEAEIQQAMEASGVSDEDVANAFASAPMQPTVEQSPYGRQPSAAYLRFLPENGGLGIDALYREIRDFLATNPTRAELEQAMLASGVSTTDLINSKDYAFPEVEPSPPNLPKPSYQEIRDFVSTNSDAEILAAMARTDVTQSDIIRAFREVDAAQATGQSPAFTRYLPENGGLGLEALYKEINDYANTHSFYELLAQMQRSGVSMKDVEAAKTYAFSQSPAGGGLGVEVEQRARGLAPVPDSSLRNREIVDYVMTHSDAEIRAQMVISNVTQDDIINAFASFDPTMPNGQSPAYARSLPENGGGGIANFYKEINDFVNTHSFYEVLSQMIRSDVSRADVQAANAYEFSKLPAGGGSGEADALAAAAEAEARRLADINALIESDRERQLKQQGDYFAKIFAREEAKARKLMEAESYYWEKVNERRAAAAAEQAEQAAAAAAQAAQAQQALEATLAAQKAATAAAAAQAAAQAAREAAAVAAAQAAREAAAVAAARGAGQAATAATAQATAAAATAQATAATAAAATAQAAQATAAATAAATSAETATAIAIAKSPGQSQAYTRFLPENGGKGITALYKEISDFVAVSSNEEIKTAMIAGGVSEADVLNALRVFPKKVTTESATNTGLVLPLVISAIAAFFVLG